MKIRWTFVAGGLAVLGLLLSVSAAALAAPKASAPTTVAVYGDWPYSTALLNGAPKLLNSVNGDPDVNLVIHVGDLHSGSMPCTGAGLDPIPTTSAPGWDWQIYGLFQRFNAPMVLTPGDNEWTDCHKTKEFASGYPLNELASERSIFFANAGMTLGAHPMKVITQAQKGDGDHKADAQFVENVIWSQSDVVFTTINMPGSNNDGLPWNGGIGAFLNEAARVQEVNERTAADIRWLQEAFKKAQEQKAKGVVIALQADMWDPAAVAPGGDGLNGYDGFVQALADLTLQFGKPVLLFNGDSHLYEVDTPLADPTSATGVIHHTQAVPNLRRITVQGSTNTPNEWLKLTVNPSTPEVFSWVNVTYVP